MKRVGDRDTGGRSAGGRKKGRRRSIGGPDAGRESPRGRQRRLPGLSIHPVTADRWKDLEGLFGERGACGGCWCMAWRLARSEWERGRGAGNRRRLMRIVKSGAEPGVLAYSGGEPVGWCAVARRPDYVALQRSRVLRPIDEEPVWSISCLFIHKDWRRRGISAALIEAAGEHAARHGARIVEGYPVIPYADRAPGAFLWTGTPKAFERAGFVEAHRWSKSRPIVRKVCKRRKRRPSR